MYRFQDLTYLNRDLSKVIIIDTGISHAYGGTLSALSIDYSLMPMNEKEDNSERVGKEGTLWKEKEVVTAIYPHKRTVLTVEEREIEGK